MATFVSSPFPTGNLRGRARRADIEIHGVDQAVPSYEGRIFLNNPDADRNSALNETSGYLGSFFVFGKVECWGEAGHCDEPQRRPYDRRRPPVMHAKVRITVPEGRLERLIGQASGDPTLSVVAVLPDRKDYQQFSEEDVLKFERLSIIVYG
ncbi:MAG: hypothetical protein ACRDJF_09630 [Actinomycetota bacterium]